MLVDQSVSPYNGNHYSLTRVHHVDGHILRVHVHRDAALQQSSAVVEVFTPAKTWTILANTAPANWHHTTPLVSGDAVPLYGIATDLIHRAERILSPAAPTGQHP